MGRCPLCGRCYAAAVLAKTTQLYAPLETLVRADAPEWRPGEGICPDCALTYARRHAASRSARSLHTTTFPHTTFPYYHPREETVLSLPERLADHWQFGGRGVTIAFLDSGYYPHPDLIDSQAVQLDLGPARSDVGRTRRLLEKQPLRLRQYLNLQEGRMHMGLDAPSLWSDAPNSWHGEMTVALCAGNGLLSQGHFRGFAPEAKILPIKIGRLDGSIPEQDILTGLRWLLHGDRWQEFGVRVLNVSVGGDYPQNWWENEVCLSVEELVQRGVLVVAAAGNAGGRSLLAPAQAPSALTVGGVDDGNRRWRPDRPHSLARIGLYHHNWDTVHVDDWPIAKPEILAPAIWIPAPVLPVHPMFREGWVIAQAWQALEQDRGPEARRILHAWRDLLELDRTISAEDDDTLRRALRLLMNPRKWVHAYYQHVDGTSVAAPQVSGVAAQIFQANPGLTAQEVKHLLVESALPLPHCPEERTGAGLLQPTRAVARALRARGGPLLGYPMSATRIEADGLRKLRIPVRVAAEPSGGKSDSGARRRRFYFGLLAPHAESVHLLGTFNRWQPDTLPLVPARNGWWHGVFVLPPGEHFYRFWLVDAATGASQWVADPENPVRDESGFPQPHSVVPVPSA